MYLAAMAVLLLSSGSALGQTGEFGPNAGDREFQLSGTGNSNNDFDAGGFGLGASLGYFLTDHFEVAVRHNMTFFDTSQTDSTFAATTRAAADFHIDFGRLQPFVGGNIGVRYGDGDIDTTGTAAPEAGLKLFALENTFVIAMMEYQFFFQDGNDTSDNFDDGQFVYTVGIGFNF